MTHRGAQYWDERYRQKELVWTAEPNRFLVDAVGQLPPGRALDLATGEGRNAVWLATAGWTVHAVDFSPVAIEKARDLASRFGVAVEFEVRDLFMWSPPAGEFRLVTLVYFQVPSPRREAVWRRAAAAVAPGGRLVVIGHDSENLVRGHGGPQDPEALYTADAVVEVVGDEFVIERAQQVERVIEDDTGSHRAIDNVVVGVRSRDR